MFFLTTFCLSISIPLFSLWTLTMKLIFALFIFYSYTSDIFFLLSYGQIWIYCSFELKILNNNHFFHLVHQTESKGVWTNERNGDIFPGRANFFLWENKDREEKVCPRINIWMGQKRKIGWTTLHFILVFCLFRFCLFCFPDSHITISWNK